MNFSLNEVERNSGVRSSFIKLEMSLNFNSTVSKKRVFRNSARERESSDIYTLEQKYLLAGYPLLIEK